MFRLTQKHRDNRDRFFNSIAPVAFDWHLNSKRFATADKGNSLNQFKAVIQSKQNCKFFSSAQVASTLVMHSKNGFQEKILRIYRKKEAVSKHLQWDFYLFGSEAEQFN